MSSAEQGRLRVLARELVGQVICPGDFDYDRLRSVFNGMIDKYPLAIARCGSVGDIGHCLRFVHDTGWPLSVRGGGHNVAGSAVVDGGLVIDLSQLRSVEVSEDGKTALVSPGARLRDFDVATQARGLTTPTGIISDTGLAGLALGGGLGWLMGRHGLTCDNLIAADVLLPSGEFARAGMSVGEDSDLLWALRGGGGNFAIVTAFQFQLHPLTHVTAGSVIYDLDQAADALSYLDEFACTASDDLVLSPTLITAKSGRKVYRLDLCHSADDVSADRELRPLLNFGTPLEVTVERRRFVDWQQHLDDSARDGRRSYWKSMNVDRLRRQMIEEMVDFFRSVPSAHTMLTIDHIHGAATRVEWRETAFGGRQAGFEFLVNANWDDENEDQVNIEWSKSLYEQFRDRYSRGSVYVNYLGAEGEERVLEAYSSTDLPRLRSLKLRYDPSNLLRSNQNILPEL